MNFGGKGIISNLNKYLFKFILILNIMNYFDWIIYEFIRFFNVRKIYKRIKILYMYMYIILK